MDFDKEMGLDLLMNPKKLSSDSISIISSQSKRSHASSKSVPIESNIIDISADDIRSVSEVSSEEEGTVVTESATESYVSKPARKAYVSEDDILNQKRELLYQFDRLEKKGMKLPRKFTMASALDEMKAEFERLRRDRQVDNSVKFQRKALVTIAAGLELANNYFNPVGARLDGWSESINENIDDYDDVFEELHEKYKGKANIAPELKILAMVGGSAFMYHLTHSYSKQIPGFDEVMKDNPELAKQFATAAAAKMQQTNSASPMGGLGNLFSMFGGMFGGGGGGIMSGLFAQQPSGPVDPQPPVRPMRGPNMDDILNEIQDDRVEVISTVTSSEFTEDQSINNLLMNTKKSKRGRKGITLDI